jgi:hypothetical protein
LVLSPIFDVGSLPLIICQGTETQLGIKDIQQTGAVPEPKGQIGPFNLLSEIRGINPLKIEMGLDERSKILIG